MRASWAGASRAGAESVAPLVGVRVRVAVGSAPPPVGVRVGVRVRVAVGSVPPLVGVRVRVAVGGGGVVGSGVAVAGTPLRSFRGACSVVLRLARMTTLASAATGRVVMAKLALLAPPGMITLSGTLASCGLVLASL